MLDSRIFQTPYPNLVKLQKMRVILLWWIKGSENWFSLSASYYEHRIFCWSWNRFGDDTFLARTKLFSVRGCNSAHSFLPLSGLSSVPDPEWLPELDWLPADEGRASRPLSSSLPWVRSPPSELLSESLRAERDEEVLLVSLRGLLEFRPRRKRIDGRKLLLFKEKTERRFNAENSVSRTPSLCTFIHTHTNIHANIIWAGSLNGPVLWLRPCCQSNQDAVCFYWSLSPSLQFTGKRERIRREGARRREGWGAQVMAEGAKMVGASQGTAHQRAFTQEGVKGRKKAAQLLKWLTYLFNAGTHTRTHTRKTRQSLKHTGMHTWSALTKAHTAAERGD